MLSAAQLNRTTLSRQHLLTRSNDSATDVLRQVMALQAQEPASPFVALWNRVADFDADELRAAYRIGTVVKASLMRITLHAICADEYTTFHQAMLPILTAARLNDRRFRSIGLSEARAIELSALLVGFADDRKTKGEIEDWFASHLGHAPAPGLWWALRTFSALAHAPSPDRPWSFAYAPSFAAAPTTPARPDPTLAVQQLVRRYLASFGPASVPDIAQFTMQKRATIRTALAAIDDKIVKYEGPADTPTGAQLFDLTGMDIADSGVHAPARLLPMWDSTLLAYADRSRILPERFRPQVIRRNGDVLPTVLVNGYVAGVWRLEGGAIEVAGFESIDARSWSEIAAEATKLAEFLVTHDPDTYRRYRRWWDKLEVDSVRRFEPDGSENTS